MNRVLVIADDLTGAAEIAGIGLRFGLPARLYREPVAPATTDGIFVYDIDSRGLSPGEAARRVGVFAAAAVGHFDLVFKKCDSALRGRVADEAAAVARALQFASAVLLPQNPSRGRTIAADGVYRIDGVPIDQTEFANDPDFPANTAAARELLSCRSGGAAPGATVRLLSATTTAEVLAAATAVGSRVLPAGGADFFTAILRARGLREAPVAARPRAEGRTMLVSGSGSRQSSQAVSAAIAAGEAVSRMPRELFESARPDALAMDRWAGEVSALLSRRPRVLVTIGRPVVPDRSVSARLSERLGELVGRVIAHRSDVASLLLEGGATASAVCRRVGWDQFDVIEELSPGVVRLRPASASVTLVVKPGSYPWPPAARPGA